VNNRARSRSKATDLRRRTSDTPLAQAGSAPQSQGRVLGAPPATGASAFAPGRLSVELHALGVADGSTPFSEHFSCRA
jgi:hypothetical protein